MIYLAKSTYYNFIILFCLTHPFSIFAIQWGIILHCQVGETVYISYAIFVLFWWHFMHLIFQIVIINSCLILSFCSRPDSTLRALFSLMKLILSAQSVALVLNMRQAEGWNQRSLSRWMVRGNSSFLDHFYP